MLLYGTLIWTDEMSSYKSYGAASRLAHGIVIIAAAFAYSIVSDIAFFVVAEFLYVENKKPRG